MMSYGIAMLAIGITILVVYDVGISVPFNSPNSCTPAPGFACPTYILNTNGLLNISIAQATGGPLTVNGIACSTSLNSTGNKPSYGNIHVTAKSTYYPSAFTPNALYSGTTTSYLLYCCNSNGIAASTVGQPFTGYVWMNYTTAAASNQIQLIASFTTKYV